MRCIWALPLLLLSLTGVRADGPADNLPDNVARVPPNGVKIPDADRAELTEELKKLMYSIAVLEEKLEPKFKELLPDVEVYAWAVHSALTYNEFFNIKEVAIAKNLVRTGRERAEHLLGRKHPWTTQTGQVVRGYRSKIDKSVQPYGMVIPKNYDFKTPIRLDFWCHGRNANLSEVNFIQSCASPGQFASDKAIVLNLYGRFCCANKLAGEVDCFEALDHARKNYAIDESRLVMRGFSMGGAAAWHFAVHYPSLWCAAAPGAGFSETPDFLKVYQKEVVTPTWYEKKLWHMYDCTDYALNLFNLPTVAYSGEIDSQKQAADIMAKAMKTEGLELRHIIGPKTGHSYEKGAKAELIKEIDAIADKGRNSVPTKVKFVTYTLRYNKCFWITLQGLDQHWERAQVEGELDGKDTIKITTKNVSRFTVLLPAQGNPFDKKAAIQLVVDGQKIEGGAGFSDEYYAFQKSVEKKDGKWENVSGELNDTLRKHPGKQGPIDDAFLDSFVMVKPTGKPLNEKVGKWCEAEMKHAATHWRQQYRGEAPMKADKDITEDDIKNSNLVLWGDPSSNAILKKIADKLPLGWNEKGVTLGKVLYEGDDRALIAIYPNPLNPRKYIVINSGFTFREYDYLNNARQVPKLPDFAVVDVSTPPNSRYPGKVLTAGFFDEKWGVPVNINK